MSGVKNTKSEEQLSSDKPLPNTSWTLEVVDEFGNSTVYDDEFTNDALALNALFDDIEKDGVCLP
mgnify:CR=1 FL=1